MYRDDVCAVCGESLPPDHFYCREHAAEVDDRLHDIGALLERVGADLPALAALLDDIAPETWDWLAEQCETDDEELLWPPTPRLDLRVHADEVDVDVDSEPGRVRITVQTGLQPLLEALAASFAAADLGRVATASRRAEGADATH